MGSDGEGGFNGACSSHHSNNFHYSEYPTHPNTWTYCTPSDWPRYHRGYPSRVATKDLTKSIFSIGAPSSSLVFFSSTSSDNLMKRSFMLISSRVPFSISCLTNLKEPNHRNGKGGISNRARRDKVKDMGLGYTAVYGAFHRPLKGSTLKSLSNGFIHRRSDDWYSFCVGKWLCSTTYVTKTLRGSFV